MLVSSAFTHTLKTMLVKYKLIHLENFSHGIIALKTMLVKYK